MLGEPGDGVAAGHCIRPVLEPRRQKLRGWCRAHRGGKGLRMALSGYAGTDYETKESGLGVLEGFFPSEKVKNELEGDKGGAGRSVGLMSGARWDTVASLGAVARDKEETRVVHPRVELCSGKGGSAMRVLLAGLVAPHLPSLLSLLTLLSPLLLGLAFRAGPP